MRAAMPPREPKPLSSAEQMRLLEIERENLALLRRMERLATVEGAAPREDARVGLPGGAHSAINRRKNADKIQMENYKVRRALGGGVRRAWI